MAVNKVVYSGDTLIDLTNDTVTADTISEGVTAHGANGEPIAGTLTAVQYGKEQSLTDEQKAQARANIGAISEHDFLESIPRNPPPGYRYQAGIRIGERNVLSVKLPDALWEQDDYKFAPAVKVTSAGNAITDAAGGQASAVVVTLSPKLEDGSLAPNPSGGRFAPWEAVALSVNGVESTEIVAESPYAGTVDFVSGKTEAAGVRVYKASDLFVLHASTAPGTSSAGVKYIRVALKQDVESLDFMNLFVACNRYERRTASPYNDKTIRVNSNAPYIYDNDIDFNNPLAILDGLEFLLSDGNAETFSKPGIPITLNQGSNTITSDAGAVTVTYGVDTKTYIDRKFAELSAALLGG